VKTIKQADNTKRDVGYLPRVEFEERAMLVWLCAQIKSSRPLGGKCGPMSSSTITVVTLGVRDVDEVYELYSAVQQSTLFGFLAERTLEDFADVLGDEANSVSIGVRDGERLVGYTLCRRSFDHPYPDVVCLRSIDPESTVLYSGMGTVIHPELHGRFLTQRLFAARQQVCLRRGVQHMVGLVDVGNFASIANILRAGACLAGFARDQTSLNYIAYGGMLHRRAEEGGPVLSVDMADHVTQRARFDAGLAVTSLNRSSRLQRQLGFQEFGA
jgi:hypothetical protein